MYATPFTSTVDAWSDAPGHPAAGDDVRELDTRDWDPSNLLTRLNLDWPRLSTDPDNLRAAASWVQDPAFVDLGRLDSLDQIVRLIQDRDRGRHARRDAMLLALLRRCQDGDRLAGQVVLHAMLPKVVSLALGIFRRPDVSGERDEAASLAVAAMWQAIAEYPVSRRPTAVPGNLGLNALSVVQRGHTGSSHHKRTFPERPCGDVRLLVEPAHRDLDPDAPRLAGPVDAELCMLLAWGVRTGTVSRPEALLLARVYGLAEPLGHEVDGPAIAQELGLTWAALRQRCHRIARRLGQAAVAEGIQSATPTHGTALLAA